MSALSQMQTCSRWHRCQLSAMSRHLAMVCLPANSNRKAASYRFCEVGYGCPSLFRSARDWDGRQQNAAACRQPGHPHSALRTTLFQTLAPCLDSSDEIPFAEFNTAVPQEVVGRGAVEIKVGQHEMHQIWLTFETHRMF